MKFELKPDNRNASDEELLEDLKKVSQVLKKESFSFREYHEHGGRMSEGVISRRLQGGIML